MKNHLGVDPRLPGVRIDVVPEPRVAANDDNGEAARLAPVATYIALYPDRFAGTEAIVSGCTLIGLWFVACDHRPPPWTTLHRAHDTTINASKVVQ